MNYLPLTDEDRRSMLETCGVRQFGELVGQIPQSLRDPKMDLPSGLSELELRRSTERILRKNKTTRDYVSFLGAGSYDHFIPSLVQEVISRGEFYTAYTPYQPEASQGTLQTIFEYQSMICQLTGMQVANASHYEGASALAEACLLAFRHTGRRRILLARSLHPEYRQVVKTYLQGSELFWEEVPYDPRGEIDREALKSYLNEEVACLAASSPNFFGRVEDFGEVSDWVHRNGSLFIMAGHPLSFGLFKSPGEWGADVACGEGQPLGIPLQYGGPYLGYFATTRALMRKMPGRLAGMTQDRKGRRAFVLTLQAREQHIRREKATSNICTNQALCALAACTYLAALGKEGVREVARRNIENAEYLRSCIRTVDGFSIPFEGPVFNEFVVKTDKDPQVLLQELLQKNLLGGFPLGKHYPELKDCFLVCVTETKTREDCDLLVEQLKRV